VKHRDSGPIGTMKVCESIQVKRQRRREGNGSEGLGRIHKERGRAKGGPQGTRPEGEKGDRGGLSTLSDRFIFFKIKRRRGENKRSKLVRRDWLGKEANRSE